MMRIRSLLTSDGALVTLQVDPDMTLGSLIVEDCTGRFLAQILRAPELDALLERMDRAISEPHHHHALAALLQHVIASPLRDDPETTRSYRAHRRKLGGLRRAS